MFIITNCFDKRVQFKSNFKEFKKLLLCCCCTYLSIWSLRFMCSHHFTFFSLSFKRARNFLYFRKIIFVVSCFGVVCVWRHNFDRHWYKQAFWSTKFIKALHENYVTNYMNPFPLLSKGRLEGTLTKALLWLVTWTIFPFSDTSKFFHLIFLKKRFKILFNFSFLLVLLLLISRRLSICSFANWAHASSLQFA